MEKFNSKFKINDFKINQIGNWVISLRPEQVTLGSLILSLNRKCASFGDLTSQEGQDLIKAFSYVENLLIKGLRANRINYLALMMIDHQVHYHVIPRYESIVSFNGNDYVDQAWPKQPNLSHNLKIKNHVKQDLTTYFKTII